MESPHVDLLAVLIAACVNLGIATFWYSRWLFGDLWMQLSNAAMEKRVGSVFWSFLLALLSAYVLSFLQSFLGVTTVSDGMFIGFLVWLGFISPTQLLGVVWSNYSFKLYLLETACKLLTFLAMGGILGA
jgi:hypothetical protein